MLRVTGFQRRPARKNRGSIRYRRLSAQLTILRERIVNLPTISCARNDAHC
jgi:hypothetical protein